MFQICFGIENCSDVRGITIWAKFCLSHSAKKICMEHFNVSEKMGYRQFFFGMKGVITFSIDNLLPHSAKKLHEGSLLCFRKFLVGGENCG